MLTKSSILSSFLMLAVVCLTQAAPAFAQGVAPTNWEANQQGAINRDAAAGALTANQAAALQNREAQIQTQQQQYMNQNGGTLAPQQQQQIDRELRGVNHNINRDMRSDAAQGNPYAAQAVGQQWQNGYPSQGQWPRPQFQNNVQGQFPNPQWQAQQNGYPQQGQFQQNGYPQQGQQYVGHHHHHHDGNGMGFGGSGFGGNGSGYSGNNYGAGGNGGNGFGGGFGGNGWPHQ